MSASVTLLSCTKNNDDAEPATQETGSSTTQYPTPPGHVIFYLKLYPFSNYGSGVDVWLNWTSTQYPGTYLGKITNVPESKPGCGSWWGVNFSDTLVSHYNFHAKVNGANNKVWNGGFDIKPDTCIQIELDNQ